MMSALGMRRSAACELLREFDLEFKRQRGVTLPRASKSNAVLIDRNRFELLRTVKRDVDAKKFPSYRDAVRCHLDPEQSYGVSIETLAGQLSDMKARLSTLGQALGDAEAVSKDDRALSVELTAEVRALRTENGDLRSLLLQMTTEARTLLSTGRPWGSGPEEDQRPEQLR
jgi:hypothetical protein